MTPGVGRRALLRTALAATGGAAAGIAAAPAQAGGEHSRRDPTVVFVHGAGGNAAGYTYYIEGLACQGVRAMAVDLPGHGAGGHYPASYSAPQDLGAFATEPSPVLAGVTLEDNADHVEGVVRRLAAHGPVMLVGQSMGGATITRVANRVPRLISRLVYLSAFCCVGLRSIADYFGTPEAATSLLATIPGLGDPAKTGVTRNNWRSADPEFYAAVKTALAADYDDAVFRAVLNLFEPEESATVPVDDARGDAATWGRVPRTYVRFTADRGIPLALQDRIPILLKPVGGGRADSRQPLRRAVRGRAAPGAAGSGGADRDARGPRPPLHVPSID